MASIYSPDASVSRRLLRRQQTIEEALDAAVAIMEELGVGGLSMSEIARRVGMRQPSLYKYFPSRRRTAHPLPPCVRAPPP